MKIRKKVVQLVQTYDTNNPFEIASLEKIHVIFEELGQIRGYYHEIFAVKIIHINSVLDDTEQTRVCAHELGHSLLHESQNSPYMYSHTLYPLGKYEKEADKFMIQLLIPDSLLFEYHHLTLPQLSALWGYPITLLEYRLSTFSPDKICS